MLFGNQSQRFRGCASEVFLGVQVQPTVWKIRQSNEFAWFLWTHVLAIQSWWHMTNFHILTVGPRLRQVKCHFSGYRKRFRDGYMTQIGQWVLLGFSSPTDNRKEIPLSGMLPLAESWHVPRNMSSHHSGPVGTNCLRNKPTERKAELKCGQNKVESWSYTPIQLRLKPWLQIS